MSFDDEPHDPHHQCGLDLYLNNQALERARERIIHLERQVTELQEANTREVERRRQLQAELESAHHHISLDAAMLDGIREVLGEDTGQCDGDGESRVSDGAELVEDVRRVKERADRLESQGGKPCRRCSECQGEKHHWLDAVSYVCKHCETTAPACDSCIEAPGLVDTGDGGHLCSECVELAAEVDPDRVPGT
jgi:hypothetical protein